MCEREKEKEKETVGELVAAPPELKKRKDDDSKRHRRSSEKRANYMALTPLWFLDRAATVHPTRTSVVQGSTRYTWLQTYQRCRRLGSALSKRSIGLGCTVAIIALNIPAIYEAHFGVPMAGAVLNAVNIRLNAPTIAFLLGHSASAAIMVDQDFLRLAEEALKIMEEKSNGRFKPLLLIVIGDESCDPKDLKYALGRGAVEYEKFLESGDPQFDWKPPQDEWQSIALDILQVQQPVLRVWC